VSKILIIEDEPDIAKVLKKRLMDYNFEVICAIDAYVGIKLAHDEKPDLIILDIMLPAGGGLSVLKNIRVSTKTAFIPVVVLTGMSDDEYKKKILQEGVEAYLQKPYDIGELVGTINTIIQRKEAK
jgi:DNA-binding response OmpR family regulator